jgi:hypothetical protein
MSEVWHIQDEDGTPLCGAPDPDMDQSLADEENIEDARERGILCLECDGEPA